MTTENSRRAMCHKLKNYDIYKHFDRKLTKRTLFLTTNCLPLRQCATHVCVGRSFSVANVILPFVKFFLSKHQRLRLILHYDNAMSEMSKYGIGKESLPEHHGGGYTTVNYTKWLADRRILERGRYATGTLDENSYWIGSLNSFTMYSHCCRKTQGLLLKCLLSDFS